MEAVDAVSCRAWIVRQSIVCFCIAGLAGCAAQNVEIHTLPPDTPVADEAAAAKIAAEFAKALAIQSARAAAAPGKPAPRLLRPADAPSMATYDPFERLNRFNYRFNARFDENVLLPIANGYRRLPTPLRTGVHNFFGNLGEVDNIINYTLQLRPLRALRSAGRLLINSTFGLGGLFDAAEKLALPGAPTGLSATLATWSVHPGPYLVIPVLGPSSLRDGCGFLGDFAAARAVNLANLYRGNESWALEAVNIVDLRAHIDFRYYASGSPFEYETIRFLYVRKRLIEDTALQKFARPQPASPAVPAGE